MGTFHALGGKMARISLVNPDTTTPEIRAVHAEVIEHHGVVTNMKATLLHSPVALRAVLGWYDLFDRVKPFLGERLAILFCDAISRQNRCELCATFMRRAIIDGGEDPSRLELSERDRVVIEYGRQLAADPNRVSDDLFGRLRAQLSEVQIVELTTFGALMIVNNVFNSALQVDLDGSLDGYRIQPEAAFG
jgi:alkylhydroperoxidase family enzyme